MVFFLIVDLLILLPLQVPIGSAVFELETFLQVVVLHPAGLQIRPMC